MSTFNSTYVGLVVILKEARDAWTLCGRCSGSRYPIPLQGPKFQPGFQLLPGDSEAGHARAIQMIQLRQHVLLELVPMLRLDFIGNTSLNKTHDSWRQATVYVERIRCEEWRGRSAATASA